MSLKEYRRKRDFKVTNEPAPSAKKKDGRKPMFVIQEHHATRLHYDFRLEANGALKSWAVTKEPTLDTKIRRLAIEVEDHPLEYAKFHGDIPEGQYGAGHVEIWDSGTYENVMATKDDPLTVAESIDAGHVEVELHGKKLKGKFVMIRTGERSGKNQWLLIKMKDEFAVPGSTAIAVDGADSNAKPKQLKTPLKSNAPMVKSRTRVPDEIRITNVDKVMFPDAGLTKGDIIAYYERIAPLMLPHLKDRPITIERYPDGIAEGSTSFWQKNTPDYYPAWIERVELDGDEGRIVAYTLVSNLATLLYLVNQGAITFHVWTSRVANPARPDYVVFDLDPGERSFADVITVAQALHELLEEHDLDSVVKTSGKSGLHVMVPWRKRKDIDAAREWAMEIASELVAVVPNLATTERSKAKRRGRLYVDVMQNASGKHVVAPYTLRATPAATISMPIEWSEVKRGLTPGKFTVKSVFRRLAKLDADPLALIASQGRAASRRTKK